MTDGTEDPLESLRQLLSVLQGQTGTTDDSLMARVAEAMATAVEELEATRGQLDRRDRQVEALRGELQHRQHRYVDLFHHAPEPYVVTDADGVVHQANAAASRLFGVSIHELRGRPLQQYVRHEDLPGMVHLLERMDSEGASTELVVTPPDGDPRIASAMVVSHQDVDDQSPELRWMLRDITDTRRAQSALQEEFARSREEADELRELDRWKDAFLSAAAHDIHEPLRAIAGTVRILLEHHELGAATPLVESIGAKTDRLTRLLRDLLDLDRFTRGTVTAQREPTRLDDLVAQAVEHAGVVDHDVEIDVPPTVVDIDPARTAQMIANLVGNARAHTPPGTAIRVLARVEGDGVSIIVEDEGPGVPPHLREEVFRPFVTRRAHDDDEPGTGLGLSLVRLFAELQQGIAYVEDGPAGGTRAVVVLPAHVRS